MSQFKFINKMIGNAGRGSVCTGFNDNMGNKPMQHFAHQAAKLNRNPLTQEDYSNRKDRSLSPAQLLKEKSEK